MIRLVFALLLFATPAAAQQICFCLKCAGPNFGSFWATAGSMKPTLQVGQCFVTRNRFDPAELTPGTVITFRHPRTGADFVKRIIAVGGQTIEMRDGVAVIDGDPTPQRQVADFTEVKQPQGQLRIVPRCANDPVAIGATCAQHQFRETLGGQSYGILSLGRTTLDTTRAYRVPEGALFVMGDNRDNSLDSRVPQEGGGVGFVPIANVIGILDEIR